MQHCCPGSMLTLHPPLQVVVGTLLAYSHPLVATVVLAVAMQQAGWLGHDMTHARNSTYNDTLLT